jgi:hypothetical protein
MCPRNGFVITVHYNGKRKTRKGEMALVRHTDARPGHPSAFRFEDTFRGGGGAGTNYMYILEEK